jgi:hypothetical protein
MPSLRAPLKSKAHHFAASPFLLTQYAQHRLISGQGNFPVRFSSPSHGIRSRDGGKTDFIADYFRSYAGTGAEEEQRPAELKQADSLQLLE